MVPARSDKVSRVSSYSGYRSVSLSFAYGAFTLSGRLSQSRSAGLSESGLRSEPRNARIPMVTICSVPFMRSIPSRKKYLALRGGPRSFRQGFSCLVLLWILLGDLGFRIRGFHSLRPDFPVRSPILRLPQRSPNPAMHASRFGLFPFRSPLLWKSINFLSLPPGT